MASNRDASQPRNLIPFELPEDVSAPENLLATYFNSSTVGFAIFDRELRYLAINKALADMNRVPVADHLGKTLRQVLGNVADHLEPDFRYVFDTGQPVLNRELSAVLPARPELGYWIEQYFPILDANGTVARLGVAVVEIAEQTSARQLTMKLREQMHRLQVLLYVSTTLASNRNVQVSFPRISAYLRRLLRQEYASFSLLDEKTGALVRHVTDFPLGKSSLSDLGDAIANDSPAGKVISVKAAMIFNRQEVAGFPADLCSKLQQEGIKSLACIPISTPRGVLGAMSLGSTRENAFHPDDLTLLRQVASQIALAIENARAAEEIEELKNRLAEEKRYLEGEIRTELNFEEIVGESAALQRVLEEVQTVASSNATVLILGETGTGKELIARALHRLSNRKDRSFIKVNCAAIPMGLLESELFGHEKGAFTGAVLQKIGRMELAHQGTMFLDEVGDIPLEIQPKLLRVLQDQEFERLGGTRTTKVDVRLIAATNRDLARSVAEGKYRSDLFYRLNVFPIHMPPLRERREDIPMLVRHFIQKYARRMDRHIESISSESMNTLMKYDWPGNVRELENVVERSVILSEGPALRIPLGKLLPQGGSLDVSNHTLDNAEREHIIRALRETGGKVSGPKGAAHRLGLQRTTLQSKMQRLGITREDYSGSK